MKTADEIRRTHNELKAIDRARRGASGYVMNMALHKSAGFSRFKWMTYMRDFERLLDYELNMIGR